MQKSTKLLFILVGLVLVSILITLSGKRDNKVSFDIDMFSVSDTAKIVSVSFKANNEVKLMRTAEGWRLNEQHKADISLVQVLQSILSQVKVKRPVSKLNQQEIVNDLRQHGTLVTLGFNDGSKLEFIAGGDGAKKKSYYLKGDEAYLVEIPGYQNYVSGIFEVSPGQWRDRLLFSSSWRSLVSLKIDYQIEKQNLSVYFDKKFLTVEGVTKLDTAALVNYINQFEYFQVNDFLAKGRFAQYDSLANTHPVALLSIEDIDKSKNKELRIYPLIQGQQFYLVTDQNNEMMVIDSKRMSNLFFSNDQFISD